MEKKNFLFADKILYLERTILKLVELISFVMSAYVIKISKIIALLQ